MDQVEAEFLDSQVYRPFVWCQYINAIPFFWIHCRKKIRIFLENLNKYYPNIKFTQKTNNENITFLDLKVIVDSKILTNLLVKSTDRH